MASPMTRRFLRLFRLHGDALENARVSVRADAVARTQRESIAADLRALTKEHQLDGR